MHRVTIHWNRELRIERNLPDIPQPMNIHRFHNGEGVNVYRDRDSQFPHLPKYAPTWWHMFTVIIMENFFS